VPLQAIVGQGTAPQGDGTITTSTAGGRAVADATGSGSVSESIAGDASTSTGAADNSHHV